jgi:negative regulator of sigma E activity
MSPVDESLTEFERNARTVLEESVLRIDARTRSRLNQARHAALEAAQSPRRTWWRSLTLMPAAGAAVAAVLVAVTLWHREPSGDLPLDPQHPVMEDMDLLADSEALELMEGGDGSFYEWATTQSDNGESDG